VYVLLDEKKKIEKLIHVSIFAADYPEIGETYFHMIYHATIEKLNEKFMYAFSFLWEVNKKRGGGEGRKRGKRIESHQINCFS
jgi:hypothetical protein